MDDVDVADVTAIRDEPDTPAHVFAARALKYRLWGTPKPVDTAVKARPRPQSFSGKSAETVKSVVLPQSSPSKTGGILLTPGTANIRRSKTVTFGAEGLEKHETRADVGKHENGTKFPGHFPTPSQIGHSVLEAPKDCQTRTKLTEKLYGAKTDKAVVREADAATQHTSASHEAVRIADAKAPEDGEDWKVRFEEYALRTEREMKKLVAKQQAAKHFARDKDLQATGLSNQLRKEQKKVQRLEGRVTDLARQMEEMKTELARHRHGNQEVALRAFSQPEAAYTKPAEEVPASRAVASTKPLTRGRPTTTNDDIWADAFATSPATPLRKSRSARSLKTASHYEARIPGDNPLRPLDTNTLAARSPRHTPTPARSRSARRAPLPANSASKQTTPPIAHAMLDDSLHLPQPSPDHFESSPFISTPRQYKQKTAHNALASPRRSNRSQRLIADNENENTGPALLASEKPAANISPRKEVDAQRRAEAAARIAARRQERARAKIHA